MLRMSFILASIGDGIDDDDIWVVVVKVVVEVVEEHIVDDDTVELITACVVEMYVEVVV